MKTTKIGTTCIFKPKGYEDHVLQHI